MTTATNVKTTPDKTATRPTATKTVASTLVDAKDTGVAGTLPLMDVKGWGVMGKDGNAIGTVDTVLLDTIDKKPRYLAVVRENVDGRLLLPIGLGTPEPASKQLKLTALRAELMKTVPVLKDQVVTHDFERHVFSALTGKTAQTMSAAEWYADPVFDPAKLLVKEAATPAP